jgi:hypothetical protein
MVHGAMQGSMGAQADGYLIPDTIPREGSEGRLSATSNRPLRFRGDGRTSRALLPAGGARGWLMLGANFLFSSFFLAGFSCLMTWMG